MRLSRPLLSTFIVAVALAAAGITAQEPAYRRGDSNGSGDVDISDPLHLLNFLFSGGRAPRCRAEADVNRSGTIDISDAVALLSFLFSGVGELAALTPEEEGSCAEPWVVRSGEMVGILPYVSEERGVRAPWRSSRTGRSVSATSTTTAAAEEDLRLASLGGTCGRRPISPSIRRDFPGWVNETLSIRSPMRSRTTCSIPWPSGATTST